MQLGISRVDDILFLISWIGRNSVMMMLIIFFVINTNSFLKTEFCSLFSNMFAKMHQFIRDTGRTGCKLLHPQHVLIISICSPLFHNGFIWNIVKVLEYQQGTHQRNRLTWGSLCWQYKGESCVEFLPIYFVGQFVKWVRSVQYIW